jgi:hypothetical protein
MVVAAATSMPAAAGLKSLQAYVDSNSPAASGCARAAGLFLEAYELIRQGNEWQVAARRLSEKYSPRVADERQKQELARLLIGVSQSASGMTSLSIENAGLAYLEMCRQRALGLEPKDGKDAVLASRVTAARKCEKRFAAGTRQKDCVVTAFEPRKAKR